VLKIIYLFYGILVLEYINYISTPIHYPLIRGGYRSYPHRNAIPKSIIRPRIIRTKENVYMGDPWVS
jgi:hypothetical protein